MSKLNDTQLILLSTASQRADRSFYPLPATLADAGDRATKAIAALTNSGFAEERETSKHASVSRTDGDLRYGVFITENGLAAIDGDASIAAKTPARTVASTLKSNKTAALLGLLQREDGASVSELIALTGWLPHTTRAALTGLRKKGHVIERSKRNDETCYRIAAAA